MPDTSNTTNSTTTPLTRLLDQSIHRPLGSYRDESELHWVLKRRLTKKEYKILLAQATGTPDTETVKARLSLDDHRYNALWQSILTKLNKDAIKQELFIIR